jgi:hypothetical protein
MIIERDLLECDNWFAFKKSPGCGIDLQSNKSLVCVVDKDWKKGIRREYH